MDEILTQLKPLLWQIGLVAIVIGVALIALRQVRQWQWERRERGGKWENVEPQGEAGEDGTIPLAHARTGMRKWKVSGVEKASGEDATWFIEAESRANAKVKAELKGMIVTAVERAVE